MPGSVVAHVAGELERFQHLSEPSLVAPMHEFLLELDTKTPLILQVGPEPLSVELTPVSFYDAILAVADSIFVEDSRRRGVETAGPQWSDDERESRDYYRQVLQEAFDDFAKRFSIPRKELAVD